MTAEPGHEAPKARDYRCTNYRGTAFAAKGDDAPHCPTPDWMAFGGRPEPDRPKRPAPAGEQPHSNRLINDHGGASSLRR